MFNLKRVDFILNVNLLVYLAIFININTIFCITNINDISTEYKLNEYLDIIPKFAIALKEPFSWNLQMITDCYYDTFFYFIIIFTIVN
jgi:hypothetical protein